MIQDEVCFMALGILNGGAMPDDLNFTYAVLIPNSLPPSFILQFAFS